MYKIKTTVLEKNMLITLEIERRREEKRKDNCRSIIQMGQFPKQRGNTELHSPITISQ